MEKALLYALITFCMVALGRIIWSFESLSDSSRNTIVVTVCIVFLVTMILLVAHNMGAKFTKDLIDLISSFMSSNNK